MEIATKKLESGNQDNSNNVSREPLRFQVPLLLCLPTQTARYNTDTTLLFLYFAPGGLRLARTRCVFLTCVLVSVGPSVMWLSCHLKLSQSHSLQSPGPPLLSSTRPTKVVALMRIRSCALHWFIKTLVWLEASTAAPSDAEKEARYSSL